MDGETLSKLQLEPLPDRRSRAIGYGITDYIDVCMVPTDIDLLTPNYTSPRDLSLAIRSEHCAFPQDVKTEVQLAIRPHTKEEDIDYAADVVADYFVDETDFVNMRADHQFVTLLQVHRAVDMIKINKYGAAASAEKSNELSYKVSSRLIELMRADESSLALTGGVRDALDYMRQEDKWYDWLYVKAKRLHVVFGAFTEAHKDLSKLGEVIPKSEVSRANLSAVNALFDQAIKDRHYGVKLCYTESIFGGTYVFSDAIVAAANNNMLKSATLPGKTDPPIGLLVTEVSDNTSFDELIDQTQTKPKSLSNGAVDSMGIANEGTRLIFILGTDGELYLDAYCSLPLRGIYEVNGREDIYETIRAEIISNFADLVLPAEVIETEGIVQPRVVKGSTANDIIARLVLPRKQYIRVEDPSEDELMQVNDEQKEDNTVRIHGVVYHKRKLLPHQHVSEKAKALAAEAAYKLPEGYTFVQAHTRGKGPGKVLGHMI